MKDENKFLLWIGLLMWFGVVVAVVLALTGCMSQMPHETIDEYIPEHLVKEEWDGSKGQFPPG